MKIGELVRIRKDSKLFGQTPPNMMGVIDREHSKDWWYVEFENGYENGYRVEDLEILPKASKLNKKLYPTYIEENGYLRPPENGGSLAAKSTAKDKTFLQAGDKIDINAGYYTAEKTGWYRFGETIEYLGE